jgi:hypothetical protein
MEKAQIYHKFFKDELDIEELSSDEYNWYYDNLITAQTKIIEINLLYFDNKKYIVIKGKVSQSLNRLNGLIKNLFVIEEFKQIAIGDKLPVILNTIFAQGSDLITNLITNSILIQKLKIAYDFKFISCSKNIEIEKVYQDLIGTIENQGIQSFFPDQKGRQYFREAINYIDTNNNKILPSELLALIQWFHNAH